jgi:hypothetical protein
MVPNRGTLGLTHGQGKLPSLVVNIEELQSEPWSSDGSSIPGFTEKLDE